MAEETLSTSTINQAEGTKVEKEINPYFAIEEKYFGIKDKKEIRRKKIYWIKFGVLLALIISSLTMIIYDSITNINNEANLIPGTLVDGMNYKQLRNSINRSSSGEDKTWVDFDDPYVIGDSTNLSIALIGKKLVISNNISSYSFLLINPTSQAIYQNDLTFNDDTFDFSNHTSMNGDYVLCAYKDPYTIPYKPVVDNYFYRNLGYSKFRRASTKDNSIQIDNIDNNIQVIQDPTLLCLVIIRVS
jgi:hypothetical protein